MEPTTKASPWKKFGWVAVGATLVIAGVGIWLTWTASAALYESECHNTFSVNATNAHCRNPVLWVYGGYVLAGAGAVVLASRLLVALRHRAGS